MPNYHYNELYQLEMYARNSGNSHAFTDLIVTDAEGNIYLANLIGGDTKVKFTAMMLQEGKSGVFYRAEGPAYADGNVRKSVYGHDRANFYDEELIRMDDLTQILMVSKYAKVDVKARSEWKMVNQERIKEGYEPLDLPETLQELVISWDGDFRRQVYEILDDRYNTPILPEWKDYIIDALLSERWYIPLHVYTFGNQNPMQAGLLMLTEEQLENIITEGINSYELDFAIEEDGRTDDEAVLPKLQGIDSYLAHFGGDLGARIQESVRLRFDPEKDMHHPSFKDVNITANHNGITGLYPPQANTVMGVANTLSTESFCFIIGEMGTGKTTMGEIVPYISEAIIQGVESNPTPQRVIVLSPAIMVKKWAREIKERIPQAKTYEITHWLDVKKIADDSSYVDSKGKVKYKKPEQWEYYIMSSETPKFTFPLEPIKDWRTHSESLTPRRLEEAEEENIRYITRMVKTDTGYEMQKVPVVNPTDRIRLRKEEREGEIANSAFIDYTTTRTTFCCPRCGGPLTQRNGDYAGPNFFGKYSKSSGNWNKKLTKENWVCKNTVEAKYLPSHDVEEWTQDKTTGVWEPKQDVQKCGFVLWQPEKQPLDSGYRKVSPAWFINNRLPRGFFKYLLADEVHEYKSGDSSTGEAFGQLVNHTEKQVLLTGTLMGGMSRDIFYLLARLSPKALLKEGIRYNNEGIFNNRYGIRERTTRATEEGTVKKSSVQKPGISPHLFPMHLMGNCAFLELNDMGYALPPYREVPVLVDMSSDHRRGYMQLATDIRGTLQNIEALKGMANISVFMNAMYQYADAPFGIREVAAYDSTGTRHVLGLPVNFNKENFVPQKVEELIHNIDEELYNPEHLINENGEEMPSPARKSLVFVKYTGKEAFNQVDTYLYDLLKARGYKVGILKNGGSYDGIKMPSNSRQREAWLHDMMEKHDWDILITNPRLVKVGLDLLSFPNIHFFQMDYSTYDYMQASRRSWRLKQTLPVKVFTYVYKKTIQEEALKHIARKIDAAMAMQGKFSEEGLRAMADSGDGMNALAKRLMNDDILEDLDTVHDMFSRKNQSFEEMQNVEFQDYDGYVMNPDYERMIQVRDGILREIDEKEARGEITQEVARRTRKEVMDVAEVYEAVIKTVELADFNKGVKKSQKAIEGQQALDLFAL